MTEPKASNTDLRTRSEVKDVIRGGKGGVEGDKTTYLEVKFSEAMSTRDSRCRTFSCSMILYRSGSVVAKGSFNAVAQALVSEVMALQHGDRVDGWMSFFWGGGHKYARAAAPLVCVCVRVCVCLSLCRPPPVLP